MNDNHDFDRSMRAVHARAVARMPARTLHALSVRRANAASAPPRPASRAGGWWLAAGFAAMFALAGGLRQPEHPSVPAGAALPSLAEATVAVEAAAYDESLAALEEDPDLYLWLASQDSLILAME